MSTSADAITRLLAAHRAGDEEALKQLVPLVYADLQLLARRQLAGRRSGHTLNTTGLVHEAYLKLADAQGSAWSDRGHFFAVASLAMRQIIVDHARHYRAKKRGGSQPIRSLDSVEIAIEDEADAILELDQALAGLGELDPRLPRVVECRFFAGLTAEETARALDVSKKTVDRDWKRARAWLRRALRDHAPDGEGTDAG
ncbi:MAG: sigma-70 family RNA polymerase sigma factor [Acidobacteriota bacterium]|jgi:RNA polymerase sigma factor (TIGR02999 family)